LLSKLCEVGWNIAVRQGSPGLILENQTKPFELIPNSWRSWEADPFPIEHNGTLYIFAEIFDYLKRRGRIGYTRLIEGKWQPWKIVIDEPFHMSYPNVFEFKGDIYMVPETSADRSLRLYKAVDFPDQWKLEKVIEQDVAFVDTTFIFRDSEILALTTDVSNYPAQVDLLLTLDLEWNILSKTVIRETHTEFSRCAGNMISMKNRSIRVSQNCDGHYGKGLIFSELDEQRLVNGLGKVVLKLVPQDVTLNVKKKWTGLHTYNSTQHYECVDIERDHYTLPSLWGRIWYKLKLKR
jgi:hypothetical protein